MASRETALILIAGVACGLCGGPGGPGRAAAAGTIDACVGPGGQVRIPGSGDGCKGSETPLSWNAQGQPGPQGDPGPAGPQGPPGLSGFETVVHDEHAPPGSNVRFTVPCPQGKRAISAGLSSSGLETQVIASVPAQDGTGWFFLVTNGPDGLVGQHVDAYVQCAVTPDAAQVVRRVAAAGLRVTALARAGR